MMGYTVEKTEDGRFQIIVYLPGFKIGRSSCFDTSEAAWAAIRQMQQWTYEASNRGAK